MTPSEIQIRKTLRDDFKHYASKCLTIRTKSGGKKRLRLNKAQLFVHRRLEEQRRRTGRVRALVLKGRQQGISTYTEGRFFWRSSHTPGHKAFILTHEQQATNNLFKMAKLFHRDCPALVRPSLRASNAKELIFDLLDSEYSVGTAGNKEAGRSSTIHLFHGSEVAFWPNAENQARGSLQAVPNEPGTEVILESTSAGPTGYFYDQWQKAERGESDYQAIFVPWHWQPEYRRDPPENFKRTPDEETYSQDCGGLDDSQIFWMRLKIVELNGIWNFRREYPRNPKEAFNAEVPGALWTRKLLESCRVHETPTLIVKAVSIDPATTSKEGSDETGMIWGGLGEDGIVYVMGDFSQRTKPDIWAKAAVGIYEDRKLNVITYESNQGGDLVATNIRTVNAMVALMSVHSKDGKRARAEPVASLYAQGFVKHLGGLSLLEDQLCSWDASKDSKSPDRLDAVVQLITYLLIDREEFHFV